MNINPYPSHPSILLTSTENKKQTRNDKSYKSSFPINPLCIINPARDIRKPPSPFPLLPSPFPPLPPPSHTLGSIFSI